MGDLQGVLDSLEEYTCDEVAIIRPVRDGDTLESFKSDIETLKNLKTMTPISFGGGIRTLKHLYLIKDLPIERLIFSSAFLEENYELITASKNLFGHQAIQCLLPVIYEDGEVYVFHSSKAEYSLLSSININFINDSANEIILYDIKNEGGRGFDWSLLDAMPFLNHKVVISGGIDTSILYVAKQKKIASVLIENKVLHKEYSVLGYKNAAKMF
tara:strand:- start:8930 stop:9571 length:642 start_codon:yes stop_codon:yes gene_type:complete